MRSDALACWTGVLGAVLMSANISYSGYAYLFWLVSSVAWILYGKAENNENIMLMNMVFTLLNLIGIYRWIIS